MNFVVIPSIGKNGMVVRLLRQLQAENVEDIYLFDNGMPSDIRDSVSSLATVIDAFSWGIYRMWNEGVQRARAINPGCYVAVLNDDIIIQPGFIDHLSAALADPNVWAACGNYDRRSFSGNYCQVTGTYKDRGFAGFAFMVKGSAYEEGLPLFDENYNWWYGDDDFVHSIEAANRMAVMSKRALFEHISNGSNSIEQFTPQFNTMVGEDFNYYNYKWNRS